MIRIALVFWMFAIIGITTMPWSDFQGHAHWAGVGWIPFAGPFDNVRDSVFNAAAFVGFGYLFARGFASRDWPVTVIRAWAAAALLSAAVELYQVYCHGRFANATDFVMNNVGALLGVLVVRLRG